MALSTEASAWADEILAAETFAEKFRIRFRDLVAHYQSNWYRSDSTAPVTPENMVFSWVTWCLPQLVYAAPMPNVQAVWTRVHEDLAMWMQHALARVSRKGHLVEELKLWVRDALLGYGVMKVGLEGVDLESGSSTSYAGRGGVAPFAVRISPYDWGCDPRAKNIGDARFQYHSYWLDLDVAAGMPGADPEVVKGLRSTYNDGVQSDTVRDINPQPATGTRDRCRLVDIWIPETREIGTLLVDGDKTKDVKAVWLRPLMPWRGPDCGPFVVLGFASVPDSPYPIGFLQPVMEELEAMWAHQRAAVAEARGAKSFVGVDAEANEAGALANMIETVGPNGIVPIPGLSRGVVQQFSIGGVHSNRFEYIGQMREGIQRMLAFSEAQQASANGKTATANSIADKNSDVRIEWLRTQVLQKCATLLEAMGWYLWNDPNYVDRFTIQQTAPDPMTGMPSQIPLSGTFVGGTDGQYIDGVYYPPMDDVNWPGDFQVTIEPASMTHVADADRVQQAVTTIQVVQTLYTMMGQMPGANIRYLADQYGEAINKHNFFDTVFSQVAQQAAGQVAAAFSMGGSPAPEGASPQLAAGIGKGLPMGAAGGMASPQAGRGFGEADGGMVEPEPTMVNPGR